MRRGGESSHGVDDYAFLSGRPRIPRSRGVGGGPSCGLSWGGG